jgi:pilus assembly protein Flp/PilA
MSRLLDFLWDETGASAAEYALILAIVGIGIVVAAVALKNQIIGALERTANRVNTVS